MQTPSKRNKIFGLCPYYCSPFPPIIPETGFSLRSKMVVLGNASSEEARERSTLFQLGQFQARQSHFRQNQRRPRHGNEVFMRGIRQLEEMFSKFSPNPQSNSSEIHGGYMPKNTSAAAAAANVVYSNKGNTVQRQKKNGYDQAKRKMSGRTSFAQRDDSIRRTIHVSDIDHQITEDQLATLFLGCGQVVDCRVCGDPNSILHFAFVEFTDEGGANAALSLSGTILGFYPIKVLPSKTAIAPVNPTFLPRTVDEREICLRTVYVNNIDKKVSQADLKLFFESICGKVGRLRVLGDYHHSTRIAFIEFAEAESATAALNCSGAVLGLLPIRVSPSKTPIRPRAPRLPFLTY